MKINSQLELDFVLPGSRFNHKNKWCEAPIKDQPNGWRARRSGDKNATCRKLAHYLVNGKGYCRQHAGGEVLDILYSQHPTHFYRLSNQPAVTVQPRVLRKKKDD